MYDRIRYHRTIGLIHIKGKYMYITALLNYSNMHKALYWTIGNYHIKWLSIPYDTYENVFTLAMVVFNYHIRKVHSEDPILKKSELAQFDCLSHFVLYI